MTSQTFKRYAALLSCAVVVFLLINPGVGNAHPRREATDADAILEIVTDHVEVQQGENGEANAEAAWETVEGRAFVRAGDTIQTDAGGEAIMVWFEDGTMVELAPNTIITVETFRQAEDSFEIEFSVIQGRVFNTVQKLINPDSRYEVHTPDFHVAVRGTAFAIEVIPNQSSTLVVNEGLVMVTVPNDDSEGVGVPAGYWLEKATHNAVESILTQPAPLESAPPAVQTITESLDDFVEEQLENILPPASTNTNNNAPLANTVNNTTTAVGEVVNNTTSTVNTVVNDTTSTVNNVTTTTTSTVNNTVNTVTTVVNPVVPIAPVTDSVVVVTDTVDDTVEDVTDTVEDVTEDVTDTVEDVTEDVVDVVENVITNLPQLPIPGLPIFGPR